MDSTDRLGPVRRRLQTMRDMLRARLAVSEKESVHELSAYDNHPADAASSTFSRSLDQGLARGLAAKLAEVDRAEAKIREGSYGVCDRCGRPINPQRLAVRPQSPLCRRCQETVDAETDGFQDGVPGLEGMGALFVWQEWGRMGTSDGPQDIPPALDYQMTYPDFRSLSENQADVEEIVDENGEVLWDQWRQARHRQARDTRLESDEDPED